MILVLKVEEIIEEGENPRRRVFHQIFPASSISNIDLRHDEGKPIDFIKVTTHNGNGFLFEKERDDMVATITWIQDENYQWV